MRRRTIVLCAAVVVVAGGLAAGGTALATGGGGEPSATGPAADRAGEAAVSQVGGGTANTVEANHDGAAWAVEVTKPDGTTVDVRLDANYSVLSVERDSEGSGTEAGDPADAGHADEPSDNGADDESEGNG
jgi:hypothetical protein